MEKQKLHPSDSTPQRLAEAYILSVLARRLRLDLSRKDEHVPRLEGLKPDAVDWKKRVLVEVYARLGALKGAQPHKVKGDILKLLLLERKLGGRWRKMLCFADQSAANVALGKSWVAAAAKEFGVEVLVVALSSGYKSRVTAAQIAQRMTNARHDC